jgi:hypothetical protein
MASIAEGCAIWFGWPGGRREPRGTAEPRGPPSKPGHHLPGESGMSRFHPTEPIPIGIANNGYGAVRAIRGRASASTCLSRPSAKNHGSVFGFGRTRPPSPLEDRKPCPPLSPPETFRAIMTLNVTDGLPGRLYHARYRPNVVAIAEQKSRQSALTAGEAGIPDQFQHHGSHGIR